MKRINVIAVGFALLLLGSIVSAEQFQSAKAIAAERKFSADKDNRKISEFNAFTKKESKPKRLTIRRKISKYSGRWKGTLYQPGGTLRSKFNFTMRFWQKGKNISGFSRISISDAPQYYGVMRLKGTVKRNGLVFREIKVTQENLPPDSYWCIKSGKLKLTYPKGRSTLKGNWQGSSCPTGTIVLKKVSRK
jgi:hypothetical protein